jgi:hypothetical protein
MVSSEPEDVLMKKVLFSLVCVLLVASVAQAGPITIVDLGTGAPPSTVGGIAMTAFPADGRGYIDFMTVPSPLGGAIGFSSAAGHRDVGVNWNTWSHGYTGAVYAVGNWLESTTLTLTLPAGTTAFYMYVEPDPYDTYGFTIGAGDAAPWTGSILGDSGANGFGFYGAGLSTITITSDVDFAVGEFGISKSAATVPEPGSTLFLLGIGLAGLRAWRKRA